MKILKLFEDVISDLRGKKYTYEKQTSQPVPEDIIKLWEGRGYTPSPIGLASVRFPGNNKVFLYPAFFWSDV